MIHHAQTVRRTNRLLALLLPATLWFCNAPATCIATELEVTLETGSVFVADVSINTINWTEVQTNGTMTARRIATSDIQRLSLCETPASNKVAEIRALLDSLQSDQYRERENAEAQLSSPEVGGQFPKMLRQLEATSDAETKYRLRRILTKVSDLESAAPSEFDELQLKSGQKLRGDAGEFQFTCIVDQQRLRLSRHQLQMLRSPDQIRAAKATDKTIAVETEIVLDSKGKFYLPEQTTLHLETDPLGNELTRKTDISSTYIPLGLKLASAEPGYIGISGYGFKFPETPTGNNSGSVFMEFRSGNQVRFKKFRGTLVASFCLPNQPFVSAGVNEFGVHIANIEHERDFIMEAFNAAGQVIATVEVGERDCPFLGVRSNELIAEIRIRSNPFLTKLKRKVDDDYAFDSVCFSNPMKLPHAKTISSSVAAPNNSVTLRNNNTWIGQRLETDKTGSLKLYGDGFENPLSFTPDAVQAFSFADRSTKKPSRNSWSVQLDEGSILNVAPDKTFRSQLVADYSIPADKIVALWPTGSAARLPQATDWNQAEQVVVLPTGRILAKEIEFSKTGYRWQTISKQIQALAPNASESAISEDPIPDVTSVNYRETDLEAAPTLWLKAPRTLNLQAGHVLLTDGQRLMFGEGHLFQLTKRGRNSIELTLNDRAIEIDHDRIKSAKLETRP